MSVGGVRRFAVTERESPAFGGTEFGTVGPYERLHGTVFGKNALFQPAAGPARAARVHGPT